jgi:hypothetical protein
LGVSFGRSSAVWLRFTPIPRITWPVLASEDPRELAALDDDVVGWLSWAVTPVSELIAAATAPPATSDSSGQSTIGGRGRSNTDIRIEHPGVSSQTRPSRPRPIVWWSVATVAPSGSSSPIKRCVEGHSSTKR